MKIVSIAVLVCVLLSVCGILTYCALTKGPELYTVKDRFVYLIEGSKQVNEIFFGAGLPVYVRDSDIESQNNVYIGESNRGYEQVMELSPYVTIDEMKTQAQYYYSSAYCDQLFERCFEGVLHEGVTVLDYAMLNEKLYQSTAREELVKREKIYLYDTMEIVRPSSDEYVNVEIQAYYEDEPRNVFTEKISFAYEEGNWYLDTPTY